MLSKSTLLRPARQCTRVQPSNTVQYDATGILSRLPTRTRPVTAEAEEAEASAAPAEVRRIPLPPIFDG